MGVNKMTQVMDKPTAYVLLTAIVGMHSGEYSYKPNSPSAHSAIKAYLEAIKVECSNGWIPEQDAADLLIAIGIAIKSEE
jgi:hypothetical protein